MKMVLSCYTAVRKQNIRNIRTFLNKIKHPDNRTSENSGFTVLPIVLCFKCICRCYRPLSFKHNCGAVYVRMTGFWHLCLGINVQQGMCIVSG